MSVPVQPPPPPPPPHTHMQTHRHLYTYIHILDIPTRRGERDEEQMREGGRQGGEKGSHQRVSELRGVVILVCDGDGGGGGSCQSDLTSCHVLGHNLQLVLCRWKGLEKP